MEAKVAIAHNIAKCLKDNKKKQSDLAVALNLPRQTVSRMLAGVRSITAVELKKIAAFCDVPVDKLVSIPDTVSNADMIHAFMGAVNTEAARNGIIAADKIIDIYIFHMRAMENACRMKEEWSSLL